MSTPHRARPGHRTREDITAYQLSQASSLLLDRIVQGVRRAGHPIRAAHASVFLHLDGSGIRLTRLAGKANMTPQAMSELVDDLDRLGYVKRVADPSDRRAKLLVLTRKGLAAIQAAYDAVDDVESQLEQLLGRRRLLQLQATLRRIVDTMSDERKRVSSHRAVSPPSIG